MGARQVFGAGMGLCSLLFAALTPVPASAPAPALVLSLSLSLSLAVAMPQSAVAEQGDLARRAPPARPADLVTVAAAVPPPAVDPATPAPVTPSEPQAAAAAATAAATPAAADAEAPPRDPNRGAVTNLPLPRFVTLKTNEGNARRGPGLTHRIDWVFTRAGMPLRVTAEYENWRRIEDHEGVGGWVHYSLLSGSRSALVTVAMADFRDAPEDDARVAFQAEDGVVGRLLECNADWCRMNVDGNRAWVRKSAIWGVGADELVD
jgi:SH3-like domain-containing protein